MSAPELEIARSIYRVEIASIDPSGGLRPLDQVWVVGLAALMKAGRQETAVEIYPKGDGYKMTSGRHRLAAATLLGWTHIEADLKPAEERSREISENLFKLDLSPLDRAAFVAELISIEREKAGIAPDASAQSVAAKARWSDRIAAEADDASDIMARAFGFTAEAAEKIRLSRRTIYRDLALYRGIRPDVASAIRTLPVADNASQLMALAKLPEAEQRNVAGLLVEGLATGVTEALGTLNQKPVPSASNKAWSAIQGNWPRLSAKQQRELLKVLPMPKGVILTIDGEAVGVQA